MPARPYSENRWLWRLENRQGTLRAPGQTWRCAPDQTLSRLKRHRKKLLDLFFFCFGNGCLNGHDFPPEKWILRERSEDKHVSFMTAARDFIVNKKDFYYNTAYLKICDYCNKSLAISIFCGRQIHGTVYRSDA